MSHQSAKSLHSMPVGGVPMVAKDQLEKEAQEFLSKALTPNQAPPKEKHVRSAVISTFQEHGCNIFFSVAFRHVQPSPVASPVVAWKVCFTAHRVLRDGWPGVLKSCLRYRDVFERLTTSYASLLDVYSKLTVCYARYMLQKISFHQKYDKFPGTVAEDKIVLPSDANVGFELAANMLDCLEGLVDLMHEIHLHVDPSLGSSAKEVHSVIHPLLVCIPESHSFIKLLNPLLVKLAKELPQDVMSGHRDRFYNYYQRVQQSYRETSSMSYVTSQVAVPDLGPAPVLVFETKPLVVELPEKKEKSVFDSFQTTLPKRYDFNESIRRKKKDDELAGLRKEIQRLKDAIRQLQEELSEEKQKGLGAVASISSLEADLMRARQERDDAQEEIQQLKDEFSNAERNEVDEQVRLVNEKFAKLKTMYSSLRAEHVDLLRQKAQSDRKVTAATTLADEERKNKEAEAERAVQLQQTVTEQLEALEELQGKNNELHTHVERLANEIDLLRETERSTAAMVEEERGQLNETLNKTQQDRDELSQRLEEETKTAKKNIEDAIAEKLAVEQRLTASQQQQAEEHAAERARLQDQLAESFQKQQELLKAATEEQARLNKALEEQRTSAEMTSNEFDDLKVKLEQEAAAQRQLLADARAEKLAFEQQMLASQQQVAQEHAAERTRLQEQLTESLQKQQDLLSSATVEKQRLEEELQKQRLIAEKLALLNWQSLIARSASESKAHIEQTVNELDEPHQQTRTCSSELLLHDANEALAICTKLGDTFQSYTEDERVGTDVAMQMGAFGNAIVDVVTSGQAATNMASDATRSGMHNLVLMLANSATVGLDTLQIEGLPASRVQPVVDGVCNALQLIRKEAELLVPEEKASAEKLGDAVESEMAAMAEAVQAAAQRIQEMQNRSKASDQGLKLEVNSRILDASSDLMQAIFRLIEDSRSLQNEIVDEGRGSLSVKDFYQKNSQWTEGLLSAAKMVGLGANTLVDCADKVVQGSGKFEELVVASHEIAASTAQLVAASKSKARPTSQKLDKVKASSKNVTGCTGVVVASAKTGSKSIEETVAKPDLSKLSLIQTKRLEMESQVRVLELEKELERERERLGELRRLHYASEETQQE